MAKSKHFYIRRTHRYMGVLLGIQFLFWTIGGLYFSWTNIDEIHGDLQRKALPILSANINLVSPGAILKSVPNKPNTINTIQFLNILQTPYYSINYSSAGKVFKVLANAETGKVRGSINREEAVKIAIANFNGTASLKSAEYITTTNGHHEYREKPLPAWAITFNHPSQTTVYISADYGKVESFRNNKWRIFDFLWMMHTMDYKERDNLNNWLLRIFSVFGLLTILSGFILFGISSKWGRRRVKKFN